MTFIELITPSYLGFETIPAWELVTTSGFLGCCKSAQAGALQSVPELPQPNAAETAAYIEDVLKQKREVPAPIALQVQHILQALKSL